MRSVWAWKSPDGIIVEVYTKSGRGLKVEGPAVEQLRSELVALTAGLVNQSRTRPGNWISISAQHTERVNGLKDLPNHHMTSMTFFSSSPSPADARQRKF